MSEVSLKNFVERLKGDAIEYIDFRFTDLRGIWHHISFHRDAVTPSLLSEGIMFDGSSIKGWKSIEDSDMILKPDLQTAVLDPFAKDRTLLVSGDVLDPSNRSGYDRDPRTIARRAELYLRQTGLADTAYFGPEPEYFVFDEVHFEAEATYAFYHLSSRENACLNNALFSQMSPLRYHQGHRLNHGSGYCPVSPGDTLADLRSATLNNLRACGVRVLKHHHEVAASQHELGFTYDTLLHMGDTLQLYKYVVHNTAQHHGKSATFMPKPVAGDNGSGMHVHQSLWKGGEPLFCGNAYNNLSEMALHYIAGVLTHAKALNAFTNPTTNSYKRLIPGYEAPVYLAYSARNRSAAIRIPHSEDIRAKRLEVRFPDPSANPYLALSAMLMAGLDGIQRKLDPGEAMEQNLYESDPQRLPHMSGSLKEALQSLEEDHDFLTQGDVFQKDQIHAYIDLKRQEIEELDQGPSPAEFKLYFSL